MARHSGWMMLLGITALAVVNCLFRPLTAPDETRYITVAWEMWQSGDWLVPHLNFATYSHKPPLMFWLMNLSWKVFGVGEWPARMIIWLFFPLLLLFQATLYRLLFHPAKDQAHMAAVAGLLIGCPLLLVYGNALMFDIMLAAIVTGGMCALVYAMRTSSWLGFAGYALAVGLGILAKGPATMVHLGLVPLLAFWWGAPPRWWYSKCLLAVAAGIGLALCWALPAALAGGEAYASQIFITQSAGRVVHAFDHQRPFWWYIPWMIIALLPFSLMWSVWRQSANVLKKNQELQLHPYRFLAAWIVPSCLIFFIISGKQIHYVLPEIAAMLSYVAAMVMATPARIRSGLYAWIVLCTVIVLTLAVMAHMECGKVCQTVHAIDIRPLLAAAAFFCALLVFIRSKKTLASTGWFAMPTMVLLGATLVSGETFFTRYSPEKWSHVILEWQEAYPQSRVAFAHTYAGEFGFYARLQQPVLITLLPDDMEHFLSTQKHPLLVVKHKDTEPPYPGCIVKTLPFKSGYVSFMTAGKKGDACRAALQ